MNIQIQTQNYYPKTARSGFLQNIQRYPGINLPGGLLLWSIVGKITLAILPLVLAGNLWVASAINSVESRILNEQQSLSLVTGENTILEKEKERLLSPVRMQVIAAEKLSLMVPRPDQIQRMVKYAR